MLRSALAVATLLLASCASAAPLEPSSPFYFDAHPDAHGEIDLRVERSRDGEHRNNWSQSLPIAELHGLSGDAFEHGGRVQFVLTRPAGTLDCAGLGHDGLVDGRCAITPNAGFADALARRGIGRPNDDQSFALTMSGVSPDVIEALHAEGWPMPSLDELVQLGIFHITADAVRGYARAGYKGGAIHTLVAFKIQGVTPEEIGGLAALGYANLGTDKLLAFRIHGVTPDFIRQMRSLGLSDLTPDTLIQLRIFGVTPGYVRSFTRDGKLALDARQLIKLRIAGVGPQDLQAGK